jgi:cysteine desulfurase
MIYLDNAATTEMTPEVRAAARMANEVYGNAHALNAEGRRAREKIDKARSDIAFEIGAEDGEVYFTSGATEGNNWCIKGAVDAWWDGHRESSPVLPHIITDVAEHHSVLNAVKALEERGLCEATYLPVDEKSGEVRTSDVENAIKDNTMLVSVMMVNNETGVMNPVWEIGDILKERHILFHVDATQALGKMFIDVNDIGCHMLTGSGHKFHAGKGRGIAYIRSGAEVANLMEGGAQQLGRRPGTEDVTAAVCLAEALKNERSFCEWNGISAMTEDMIAGIADIPDARINGEPCMEGGIVSVGFKGVENEALITMLENRGVICSAGSACTAGTAESSHVLRAMNVSEEYLHGTVRLSAGALNTRDEVRQAMRVLKECVETLRKMGGR